MSTSGCGRDHTRRPRDPENSDDPRAPRSPRHRLPRHLHVDDPHGVAASCSACSTASAAAVALARIRASDPKLDLPGRVARHRRARRPRSRDGRGTARSGVVAPAATRRRPGATGGRLTRRAGCADLAHPRDLRQPARRGLDAVDHPTVSVEHGEMRRGGGAHPGDRDPLGHVDHHGRRQLGAHRRVRHHRQRLHPTGDRPLVQEQQRVAVGDLRGAADRRRRGAGAPSTVISPAPSSDEWAITYAIATTARVPTTPR